MDYVYLLLGLMASLLGPPETPAEVRSRLVQECARPQPHDSNTVTFQLEQARCRLRANAEANRYEIDYAARQQLRERVSRAGKTHLTHR
jgi:hypothetical protein